jgi:hypothetical protein
MVMRRGLAMLAFCASTLAFAPVHRRPSMSTLGASMNVNDIVDKAYEGKSFAELAASPVSALQGMADWTDAVGEDLKIPTVGQLGRWKYFLWARAFADLAEHEMPDRRVDGSTLNANKALDEAHEGKTIKEILALPPRPRSRASRSIRTRTSPNSRCGRSRTSAPGSSPSPRAPSRRSPKWSPATSASTGERRGIRSDK